MTARTALPALALALAAVAAGTPPRASAQMVPRLVSYPRDGAVSTPCAADPQSPLSSRRTIAYAAGAWHETVVIYRDRACAPAAALFTMQAGGGYRSGASVPWIVAYRTVTPTPLGAAYLQQQCGQVAWSPGVMQIVSPQNCAALAALHP
jgi:hypothetical protein